MNNLELTQKIVPINILTDNKYLIPSDLHKKMFMFSNKQFRANQPYKPIKKNTSDGIYLVSFRRLNKNSNILIYNYIKYSYQFLNSLIVYFITRNNFIDIKEFSDKKNYFVVLENTFLKDISDLIVPKNEVQKDGINIHNVENAEIEYLNNISNISSINSLIEICTRHIYISNVENLGVIVDKSVHKHVDLLTEYIFKGFNLNPDSLVALRDDNILNSSLYVIRDLDILVEQLESLGYIVNEGPQKWRGQINSINSFLNTLDYDYRESLYDHYQYHKNRGVLNPLVYPPLKPRSFSFNTIHQNLGNVRWYSTNRKLYSTINSRNKLFEQNFLLLKDIMDNNQNINNTDLQKKIEDMLFNQENLFSSSNIKTRLKFSDKALDYIKIKQTELKKFLKTPYTYENRISFSNELLPWCEKIQIKLGDDKLLDLLLSYYMSILTKETITIEDQVTPGIPTLICYTDFGKKLFNKYLYSQYIDYINEHDKAKQLNLTLSQYISSNIEYKLVLEDDTFYPRIGGMFLRYLQEVSLLTEEIDQSISEKKETMFYIRIHPEARSIFLQENVQLFHIPMKLPMVCEPKPYIYSEDILKNQLGGYLLNDVSFTQPIIKTPRKLGKPTKLSNDNIIVDEVNGLASTPYKINIDTLNYIFENGISKKILIDPEDKELVLYMNDPYKSYNKRVSKKFRSLLSKVQMERNILNIALIYSVRDKIYFPTRLDFRTRIYCDTDYFDYQKSDLARGLILFAEPGKVFKHDISAINYFKAFGANMFGSGWDKKSLNSRVKWVDDNSDYILNFNNNDIIDKAENKVSFISFCFEYQRFVEYINDNNRNVFYTYLPIQLDARCNCYQHLALLTKENFVYDKLNLVSSTFDDEPNDFYSHILSCTNVYIGKKIESYSKLQDPLNEKELKILEDLKVLKDISFDRSIVKKTIMTKSYNAGIPKQVDLIVQNLEEYYEGNNKFYKYKDKDIKIKRNHINMFVMCLRDVINTETPRIKELSKYLDSIATICTKLSIPIPWKLPNGAEINESYLVSEEKSIKAFSFVKSKYTFKKYLKDVYNLRKQKRSTTPNLIHSLDATTIGLLYKDFKKIGPLFTVHDCFAVTADNVNKLISKLRLVYTQLYSDTGYLINFDTLVRTNINNTFGDKVFEINSDHINIYNGKKINRVPFPDVKNVINYDYNDTHLKNAMTSSYLLI